MIVFEHDSLEMIYQEAKNAYPSECCGVLLGRREGACRLVRAVYLACNNLPTEQKQTAFRLDEKDLLAAERLAEEEEEEIVGFFHSHPDYPAVPSDLDAQYGIPEMSYPIVAVHRGAVLELQSWEKKALTGDGVMVCEDVAIH
jgi:proteasome lid subunit RPN8/RPN11